ncbi:MAG: hypothetical protein Q9221_001022 [Calogaya cf. arnoldii]
MVVSSRSSSIVSLQDHVDSTWQLVTVDKASTTGPGQATTVGQPPTKRHRRGQTEGPRRLSIFRSRSRTNTISNPTMGHRLSPSVTTESSNIDAEYEDKHPQSGWSDSDHSDSQSKSWVARGSKMLKKQNSKFALSSSKTAEWVDEHGQAPVDQSYRSYNKHGRMWSTGLHNRPQISQPYNFKHLTHTQPRHFSPIRSASQDKLATEYFATNASESPVKELRGIPVEDIRSHPGDSSRSIHHDPITPPLVSPAKSRASRPNSGLSIGNPCITPRSRSIDNFSQPSPKTYRFPRSPTSPPPRTSSRNATHAVPDFFSDQHHATAEEREFLLMGEPVADKPVNHQSYLSATPYHCNQLFDEAFLPHAITTPDDVAFTLQPPMLRRSTLALADVPEEDELHSTKRASLESSRAMTADSILRHAKSFPSNRGTKHNRNGSSSCKSTGRPDSAAIDGSLARDLMSFTDTEESVGVPTRCRKSRISSGNKSIDACWEDDIDYCYQLRAEADCDFEWDRISMNDMQAVDETHNKQACTDISRESGDSLSRSYELLKPQHAARYATDEDVTSGSDGHRLPRLQTSLPDLEFSAASSAKSSMASLRGPITPLQQLPSPGRGKIALPTSKSTDTLNLDSSFFTAQECEGPWSYEGAFSRDHTSVSSQKSHLAYHISTKNSSARSSRPLLSRHASSESVMLLNPSSSVRSHRHTASGGSLKEMACSKNYRQHMENTTKQISDRLAALSVANSQESTIDNVATSNSSSSQAQHSSYQGATGQVPSNVNGSDQNSKGSDQASSILQSSRPDDQPGSIASFASKLRSNSIASSASGSSMNRTSRISYSLFPSVPSPRA